MRSGVAFLRNGADLADQLQFFSRLGKLFESNAHKNHGSVFLTQKRREFLLIRLPLSKPAAYICCYPRHADLPAVTHGSGTVVFTGKKDQTDTLADLHVENPLPVLVRATNGDSKDRLKSKVKISTIVQPAGLDSFFSKYAEVCRAGMTSLKKRDRSLQKKKAKKRKVAAGASSTGQS